MSLLYNKNFLVMWIGQLATIFGNRFSEIAIPLIVLQLTGSPWQAALVVICSQIIPLVLALPVGSWVEGKPKRSIAMIAEAISFLTMSSLVIFVLLDLLTIWLLAGSLLILGATGLFFKVSFGAMVPGIVGRERLVSAHSYFEGADAISTLIGPVMAGVVLSTFGVATVLGIDAMTYLVSFLGIVFLSYKENRKKYSTKPSTRNLYISSIRDIKYLFGNRYQRFISLNHSILNFTTTAVTLSIIVYTSQTLKFSEWQTGMVLSAAGAGNLVGVFLLNWIKHFSWRWLYAGLILVSSIGLLIIVMTSSFPFILLGMFLFDGALSMGFIVNGSARQSITPDNYLARIGGGGILIAGMVAISGNLFAGGIAESVSAQLALGICALLLLISFTVSSLFKSGHQQLTELKPIEFKKALKMNQ